MITIHIILNELLTIIMSLISPQKLIRIQDKLCSQPFLKELRGQIRSSRQQIAKSTYNLQSRNIKKFTQEWQAFRKKIKSEQSSNSLNTKSNALRKKFGRTLKYEQNQSLQLQYDRRFIIKIPQIKKQPESRVSPSFNEVQVSVSSKPTNKSRYSLKKNYMKGLRTQPQKISRQKSITFVRESHKYPRKRIVTQWQSDASKQNYVQSRLSMKKGESAPNPQLSSDDFFVDLSRQRINNYIKNLHQLQWMFLLVKDHKDNKIEQSAQFSIHMRKFKYDIDSSIDQYSINYMISRRYNLLSCFLQDSYERRMKQLREQSYRSKDKSFLQPSEYSLLDSLTSGSVINLIKHNTLGSAIKSPQHQYEQQKEKTLYFSLPHCEFISYRYTKSSIYQLISMSNTANLKLAFTIYDKNRNGVIDTDDLVQIISLSRKIPILQADIMAITRAMMSENRKSAILRRKVQIQSERLSHNSSISDGQQIKTIQYASPIKEQQSQESSEANERGLSSSRFNIDKLYTFLKSKEQGKVRQFNRQALQNNLHTLTFGMFCKAFHNERPVIILDMFQYLFAAPTDHFHPRYRNQLKTSPKQLNLAIPQQQTLQQKWNRRLKQTNSIIQQFVKNKSKQKF